VVKPDEVTSTEDSVQSVSADKADAPSKLEHAVRVSLEDAGGNNSNSERQEAQSETAPSRITIQARTSGVEISAKPESSTGESRQVASAVVTAAPITVNDTKLVPGTKAPSTAAAQAPDFVSQLADRIQVQLRDGKNEIRIQLHPENLGNLEIRAENTVGGVVARIVAESVTVKNYLESNLHLLQQSLTDQGLKIDRIQVTVQDNGSSQSSMGYAAQSGYAGSGNRGRGSNRSSDSTGYVDGILTEESGADQPTVTAMRLNSRFYTVA
jgi:flagellar hook-length control protein FliK